MNRILVIDDNEDYRTDLMETLEFENYVALGAENGLIGLQMIRRHSPNLVLCDVDMPGMNGIDVLKTLKAHPTYSQIPFIVVSGHSDEMTIKAAHDLGARTYLTKPVRITKFLATIAYFLQENNFVLLNR